MASKGEPSCEAQNSFIQVNEIRSATDEDFDYFIRLVEENDGWIKKLDKGITVWQKETSKVSPIRMAKVRGEFADVSAATAFDTILDGEYRRTWDDNVIEDYEVFRLDGYNDVGYYSMKCPGPLKNRDFVNQRSWKIYNEDQFIVFNHSVSIKDIPLKTKFVRGVSYITGFLIRRSDKGCVLDYITQSDPKGKIPSWIINLAINKIAPSIFRKLYTACCKYEAWKAEHRPDFKPWRDPTQNELKVVDPASLVNMMDSVVPSEQALDDQEVLPEDEAEIREMVDSIAEEMAADGVTNGAAEFS